MKLKLAALAILLSSALPAQSATPTLISVLTLLAKCPTTAAAFVLWSNTGFYCVALPAGWTATGTPPVLTAPTTTYTPVWQVETVSLATLAAGSTSISYTTLKSPASGVVNFWYNSTNLFNSTSGAIAFTGQPLTFTLPAGWAAMDTITVSYQSQ